MAVASCCIGAVKSYLPPLATEAAKLGRRKLRQQKARRMRVRSVRFRISELVHHAHHVLYSIDLSISTTVSLASAT